MRLRYSVLGPATIAAVISLVQACSSDAPPGATVGGSSGDGGSEPGVGGGGGSGPDPGGGSAGTIVFGDAGMGCEPATCASLGWECGSMLDGCGNVINCADEGLECGAGEVCIGGTDGPAQCQSGGVGTCEVCQAIPDCSAAPAPTRLTGRVITPGRSDTNVENQVGVPNAIVYILRNTAVEDLPPISSGLPPSGGLSCDRCEDQDLGPLLLGTVTDARGDFVLEGNIPVGREFLLVVKAGKFRRAVTVSLPAEAACTTTTLPTALPENPTRLPRHMADGLAVNIPRVAISTGRIDAMECVFEKMGIAESEFAEFGSQARVHLYRGGPSTAPEGANRGASTPHDATLYGSLERLESYDMVVSDCEGGGWDGRDEEDLFPERIAYGDNVRQYVNRGGRLFASHLSFSWLHENGSAPYSAADPVATGLGSAATWDIDYLLQSNLSTAGTGVVSLVGTRPNLVSPRIESFAEWLVSEDVTTSPGYTFAVTDPRSMASALGPSSEEFVYRSDGNARVQQFSFDTPYAAPAEAACGRVAYSGFHVASTGGSAQPFLNAQFPAHCTNALANDGNLTNQEKVLLYMLFDLGACVGDVPVPPTCVPLTCETAAGLRCGPVPDGCGNVIQCGTCRPPE